MLLEEAEEWLRDEGILFPAESAIQKMIAQVRPQVEQHVFSAITRKLNPDLDVGAGGLVTAQTGLNSSLAERTRRARRRRRLKRKST